ncbi:MAG: polysaccharide biosynthesis protein [Paludibacteraceae bacterium]|nr:polysaccharide biosynthesis protein [Paludibacteraceae bacterium]
MAKTRPDTYPRDDRKSVLRNSDIFSHLANLKYLPRWLVLMLDTFLCVIAFLMSFAIGGNIFTYQPDTSLQPIWIQLLILLAIQVLCFWIYHTYSGILRYSTFVDTIKVLLSVITAGTIMLVINAVTAFNGHKICYNTVTLIYMPVAFLLLFSLRVTVKTVFETILQNMASTKKVLIYGTKQAGIAIAKMLRSSGDSMFRPVGFIEDNPARHSYNLLGMKVYPLDDTLIERMQRMGVSNVIVSPLKMKELRPSRDLRIFLENDIHVLTTPYFKEWEKAGDSNMENNNSKLIGAIEAIRVEDLLDRPTINIDTENVRHILEKKVVMVTGAAGSIGSELIRQIAAFHPRVVILFEQAESPLHDFALDLQHQFPRLRIINIIGDVRDRRRVEEIISDLRPNIIFHAAAYKHVPLMESHPNEAVHANVLGTKNMADMAVKYNVERFVMISTDKAVNPTNIMGASKRIAEIYVQSLFNKLKQENPNCTRFITTRFGNVLGSNGSVIPYFKKQIAAGGPVTVTSPDIIRYFMTIPEACCLVLEACTLGEGGEIFVFDMGQPVKILDLAKNMIRLAGYVPNRDIRIEFTGLRPGEKLYEELLNQKETTLPTQNEKIMIARVREFDFDTINGEIDKLINTSYENKPFMTVMQMKNIVPEFISKNSIYEQLDK